MDVISTGVMGGVVARGVDATQEPPRGCPVGVGVRGEPPMTGHIEVDTVQASTLDGKQQDDTQCTTRKS